MKNTNTIDNYALVIPAGGTGKRLGADVPKQFLKLNGKEILLWTLDAFNIKNKPKEVIISCHKDWVEEAKGLTNGHPLNISIIVGGKTRAESVFKALKQVKGSKYVLVHDSVRPIVSENLINNILQNLEIKKAVIPAIPVSDTIKIVEDQTISSTPNRKNLYAAQTPQAFELEMLIEANEFLSKENIEFTDDASIVENYGKKVSIIDGEIENIKITRPLDIQIAKILLK